MLKFFRKYHKWLGIISVFFIILISLSGIVLNHRKLLSNIDLSRNVMPKQYRLVKWNNAALRSDIKLNNNKILIYGNIGVWETDSTFSWFKNFNKGFENGIDNRKICKIYQRANGELFAASLFGLYKYENNKWNKIKEPFADTHIVDIDTVAGAYAVLTRSYLYLTKDFESFKKIAIKPEKSYDNKTGLFKTLWVIHSGEIWGISGILIVDLIAFIFIFLSITGVVIFFRPSLIRKKLSKNKDTENIKKISSWSLNWHNKIGWTTAVLLLLTTITGMFLRPPLLIPIANAKVSKIPFSELDTPNQWFDKLRRIKFDQKRKCYYLATIDGIFKLKSLNATPEYIEKQPPVSMMGVNAFDFENSDNLIVGSFNGLYLWNLETFEYKNAIKSIKKEEKHRSFLSANQVTAYIKHYYKDKLFVDYNTGIKNLQGKEANIKMPEEIKNTPISLWNVALEFHTGRIYQSVIGGFYFLIVPVSGIISIFLIVSGFWVWYKIHRKK